jgi:hypothetical protein
MLLLLLGCVLLELTQDPLELTQHPPDGTARGPDVTRTVTLAIQRDIEAILDGYGPFLRADTPLLQRSYHTEGQAANDTEWWVLPTTAAKFNPVCTPIIHRSNNPCHPSLKDVCLRLMRNFWAAAVEHQEVARSLSGPSTLGLWLTGVQFSMMGLVWNLDNIEAAPRRLSLVLGSDDNGPHHATTVVDEAADDVPRKMTARVITNYVNWERDSQRSSNDEIRRELLPLREKCASIVADIRLITDPDAPDGACKWAELSPLAGPVEQLVSAIDENLAALDAVDDTLLGLSRWLKRMPCGYFEVDEVVGETVVRTRFQLPPPAVISEPLMVRLKRMGDDASALQEGWIEPTSIYVIIPEIMLREWNEYWKSREFHQSWLSSLFYRWAYGA